jgi:hypothetical protein
MSVIGKAVLLAARRSWRRFDQACADPAASQAAVLRNLLQRAADTRYGRQFGFASLPAAEEFCRRVPITRYEAAAPLWHQAFDGARDVTWPGHVRFFAMSSGTTAGNNKLIPATREAIGANMRSGLLLMAFLARVGGQEDLVSGKVLYLGGSTTLQPRGKSLVGDASGIVRRHTPFFLSGHRLPEHDIVAMTDWEEKITQVVRRYLTADVRTVGACPSWAALLFKQMLQEAHSRGMGRRAIGQLWPKLSHFFSFGMAFDPYRSAFEEYIGRPIHYTDTYSSSEAGMTAIQEEPGGPLRMIVDNGVFFEFIPAHRAGEPSPPRLHIGQVEVGQDYALVISTNAGIWAYPLGDVVRFESLRPPRIVFAGRTQVTLSAFGEHVTLEMIEKAMAAACRKTSAIVADYTIAPRFPSPAQPRPAHRWIVEFDRPPSDPDAFTATIDASIRSESEDYATRRTNDFGLAWPILVTVAPRTFYTWMKQKGKLGGQNKVPRVALNGEMVQELGRISLALAAARVQG